MARIQDVRPQENPDIVTEGLKALMKSTLKKDLVEYTESIIDDVVDRTLKSMEVNIKVFKDMYNMQDYYKVKVERI